MIARPASVDEKGRLIVDEAFNKFLEVFIDMLPIIKTAGSFDGMGFLTKRLEEYGNGARIQIFVEWKNKKMEVVEDNVVSQVLSAHTFVGENRDGKVFFIDPQTGNEDCRDYFTKVRNGATMYARIDNLPINKDIIDLFVTSRGG